MLDGIRGIAILLVLFHHFVIYSGIVARGGLDRYLGAAGGGSWVGVDLFFALSGFLITGILCDTKSSPRFFRTFYGRRTLRIFPLYYGVLAVVFLIAPILMGRPLFQAEGQWWYWSYLSNVDAGLHGWQAPPHLGHFWSLAVEEQFYLVWPLVVFALERGRLLKVTLACFAAALLLRTALPLWGHPLGVHVLMPARMDALAAGAFVALVIRGPRGSAVLGEWPSRVLLGSLTLLTGIFVWRRGFGELDPVVRTVGYSLIALAGASLIAVSLRAPAGSMLRKVLSSKPLVVFGTYSYGLYVFHHIVVWSLRERGFQADLFPVWLGSELPGLVAFSAVAMSISALCAYASWHLWEMPFLRLKRYVAYKKPVHVAPSPAAQAQATIDRR